MLSRRRGGQKTSRKKMAKKSIPAALQTEVSNDEEWSKLLDKKGLLVVDVYSEWSGPCTGMTSILKKIKMEIGGDALSYATAKCDYINDLERFQGKSEPTWMFIHDGRMINLMFGAYCPQFVKILTTELRRVQNGEQHEFSLEVFERSPEEQIRLNIAEEARIAKETARRARKEAETKARYEAEMQHLTTSLIEETCVLLYPWVFKDEEGRRRDKKCSPPYVELVEEILPGKYEVAQEMRKRLKEDILEKLFYASDYVLTENAKQLLLDGKCMLIRLKLCEGNTDVDVHKYLLSLLFGEPVLLAPEEPPSEEWHVVVYFGHCSYAGRHRPALIPPEKENNIFPVIWTPPDEINKAHVYQSVFSTYLTTTYPYEDKTSKAPVILFKYDNTKKNDLKMVLEMFSDEVVQFGIFDSDKPPESKMIWTDISEFEESAEEKTGYEVFICAVKKVECEAFLGFAGIGPFHVSENPEKAAEEVKLYFPDVTTADDVQSDDEEKPEDMEEIAEADANTAGQTQSLEKK